MSENKIHVKNACPYYRAKPEIGTGTYRCNGTVAVNSEDSPFGVCLDCGRTVQDYRG